MPAFPATPCAMAALGSPNTNIRTAEAVAALRTKGEEFGRFSLASGELLLSAGFSIAGFCGGTSSFFFEEPNWIKNPKSVLTSPVVIRIIIHMCRDLMILGPIALMVAIGIGSIKSVESFRETTRARATILCKGESYYLSKGTTKMHIVCIPSGRSFPR